MQGVRIAFTKTGRAIYISHLDLNRVMLRAVRRANLDLWYTEGFNPHPYLVFALPLSLGHESMCETMDIRLNEDCPLCEIRQRMQAVMPEGLDIIDVYPVRDKHSQITMARYSCRLVFNDSEKATDFSLKAEELLSLPDSLTAQKLGKKGHRKVLKEVNLSQEIISYEVLSDGTEVKINLVLPAGSTKNINPSLVIESLCSKIGFSQDSLFITRERLLKENGEKFE